MIRSDGRTADVLRRVEFEPGWVVHPAGSTLVRFGRTVVLCTASVVESVPRFREGLGGWLTAEYSMLPGATHTRSERESASKPKGRTQEIQRLIGRSLRPCIDLEALGPRTVQIDCDVLQADGGTRTAAVTGGFVALALAVDRLLGAGRLTASPIRTSVSAVSVGIVDGTPLLDLCYEEDVRADADANVVSTLDGRFVEVQATGENATMSRSELSRLLDLGEQGCAALAEAQRRVLGDAWGRIGLPGGSR